MAKEKKLKPVGIGHNSDLTEDQRIALHLNNHVPSYERALKAKKDADAAFKNICKTIKAEGGSIDEVKLTIELRTPEGEAKLKATIEQQLRVARWNGLPVGTQGDMFGPDRRPAEERAAADGKRAGLAGENCQPPSGLSQEANAAWVEAWHAGQSVLAAGFKTTSSDTELLRPESEDEGQSDDFNEAADGDVGDDTYQIGDEVDVGGGDDEGEFEPPAFLQNDEEREEA